MPPVTFSQALSTFPQKYQSAFSDVIVENKDAYGVSFSINGVEYDIDLPSADSADEFANSVYSVLIDKGIEAGATVKDVAVHTITVPDSLIV